MTLINLRISAVLLLVFCLTNLQAQETIPTTGGEASGGGGSASYSLGQVVYTTNTGSTGSVEQGVQHAYSITVESGIEQTNISLSVTAYPNPTTDYLQLKIENENLKNLSYQIYNLNGSLLQNEKITSKQTNIPMSHLLPATYIIKVTKNNMAVKVFKIINTR